MTLKVFFKRVWQLCQHIFRHSQEPNNINGSGGSILEPIHASDDTYIPPAPPTDGFVRLLSPFSQEMFCDVPLERFCEVDVQSKDLEDSNHFLLSLWNEMNKALHPAKCDYVPWYYRPDIVEVRNNWKLLMLGDVHTSSGNFHILLRMQTKERIKSILAFNSSLQKEQCELLFENLVSNAKKNIDTLRTFTSSVRLSCNGCEIKICGGYSGDNFYLHSDSKGIVIDIRVRAIDQIEAKQQLSKRLEELCAFLSVETNLLFKVNDDVLIDERDAKWSLTVNTEYIKPFIDGPSIRNGVLLLSEVGVAFLNQFVFVERDTKEEDVALYFKRGCEHFYEGLQRQQENQERIAYLTRTQALVLSPKDTVRSQYVVTMAAMSYLSALETASMPEGKPETCKKCGNVIYKIGSRVESLVAKYLNLETGREFKGLYNLRSQYLHSGKLSCDKFYITARPLIDPSTGSGLSDYGFISCRVNGKLMSIGLSNIQELTAYVLRCYYQEKIFGLNDFEPQDDYSNDIDVKQMIINKLQGVMPEGVVVEDVTTM